MKNHQHINGDSGSDEYFTLPEIITIARTVLGQIDLDPASSTQANKTIQASRIYTIQHDGLKLPWLGRIWLNHPFGKTTNKPWIAKLCEEYQSGQTTEAICICFAATSEQWFRPLLNQPQCFLHRRTNYHLSDGTLKKGVTKGSVLSYFGPNPHQFAQAFAHLGTTKTPFS